MDAIYVCKCHDGVKRNFSASTQASIEDIKKKAAEEFNVSVDDLVEEIRQAQEEADDETADEENAEGVAEEMQAAGCTKVAETLDLGALAQQRMARYKQLREEAKAKNPVADWLDDLFRKGRPAEPAIYRCSCEDGLERLVRGNVVETVREILFRAAMMHKIRVLGLVEEIPLGPETPMVETPKLHGHASRTA